MARVRDRDVAAFEAIYDGYNRLVYGIALRMLGEVSAAQDLTQSVFMKVWSSPESFTIGNFGAWLARVARNRALDVLRGRASHLEGEMPNDIALEGTIDEIVFARIDGARVRAAMSALPAEQREPIELGFFGGITHEEIARRTETPLGTIKTRIRTGLRALRSTLETEVPR
jgi:RNA polymerase sigma-70 factor (ECF subfamily)